MWAAVVVWALAIVGALGLRGVWRTLDVLDPAEGVGFAGLVFLGFVGWIMFPVGLLGGAGLGPWVLAVAAFVAFGWAWRAGRAWPERIRLPRGALLLLPAALTLLALVPLAGTLAPADPVEWDSLAYHLAIPKMWLEGAAMQPIPWLHHSFFPFAIDNLFVIGQELGGEAAAKAFTFALFGFGLAAVFGAARRWFGGHAGWWSALAFAGVPLVLWQSGTAYIDVGHGLFAALGGLYCIDRIRGGDCRFLWIGAAGLGLAVASKYTGLQALAATAIVLALGLRAKPKEAAGGVLRVVVVALAIGCPWYVRNALVAGNPVYPFFLGGKYWSDWRAEVYRNEQLTFGVGRTEGARDVTQAPHAVLGLAYQPGRFINPNPMEGTGFPIGAIGGGLIAAGLAALASGLRPKGAGSLLLLLAITLAMWFFLSQQSRYILSVAPLLALLAGGAVIRLRAGPLVALALVAQAGYTFWLLKTSLVDAQLPVVLGRVDRQDWVASRAPFAEAARDINQLPKTTKVALFDEVFGHFLDVPYLWANPAHSNLVNVPPDGDAAKFIANLRDLGCTHVYWSWQFMASEERERTWALLQPREPADPPAASGARGSADGWRPLLLEAAQRGILRVAGRWRSGVLMEIVP